MFEGIKNFVAKLHDNLYKSFAGFGAFCTRNAAFIAVSTSIFLLLMSLGLIIGQRETHVDRLWIKHGTRLVDEKQFFNDKFGGLPRVQQVVLQPATSSGFLATVNGVLSLRDTLVGLSSLSLRSTVGQTGGAIAQYSISDFCDRPPVPRTLSPNYASVTTSMDGRYAVAYKDIVDCLRVNDTSFTNSLPSGWGVDRFPCTRVSALDCFKEGQDFDYPDTLKQLDLVSRKVSSHANLASCLNWAKANKWTALLASEAEELRITMRDEIIPLFRSWGYEWRKSYASMSDSQVSTHLKGAISAFNAGTDVQSCITNGISCCLDWRGRSIPSNLIFGDLSSITTYRAVIELLPFNSPNLVSAVNFVDQSNREALFLEFENLWFHYLNPKYERAVASSFGPSELFANFKLNFLLARSLDDATEHANSMEVDKVVIAYALVAAYTWWALLRISKPYTVSNAVYSRVFLGFGGLAVVGAATVAAYGFTAIISSRGTPANYNTVVPLSLALGMQSVYLFIHHLNNQADEKDVVARMKRTIGAAGPPVFITHFVHATVFLIASTVEVNAVQNFMGQLAANIIIQFIAHMGIFVPMMGLDVRRTLEKRTDICIPPMLTIGESRIVSEADPAFIKSGNFLNNFFKKGYIDFLLSPFGKIVVLLSTAALVAGLGYNGFANVHSGLAFSDHVVASSYQREFLLQKESPTTWTYEQSYLVTKTYDYVANQAKTLSACAALINGPSSYTPSLSAAQNGNYFWAIRGFSTFSQYATRKGFTSNDIVAASNFSRVFTNWVDTHGFLFANDFAIKDFAGNSIKLTQFNSTYNTILATKSPFWIDGVQKTSDQYEFAVQYTREYVDRVAADYAFPYGEPYLFYEQYLDIEHYMYKTVGYALIGALGGLLILQMNFPTTIITVLVAIIGIVEIYGIIVSFNNVNAYLIVNGCMAVGLAVQFDAHIGHQFLSARGSRDRRVRIAMEDVAASMFHGFVGSGLAYVVLSWAQMPFLYYYYFGFFLVAIVVTTINGLVLFPVLLSLFGGDSYRLGSEPADDDAAAKMPLNESRSSSAL